MDEIPTSSPSQPAEPEAATPVAPLDSNIKPERKNIFDPATGSGRFMRSLTRNLAIIVALLAAGILVTYFLLYYPTQQRLMAEQTQLATAQVRAVDLQATLDFSTANLKELQKQAAQLQTDVKTKELRIRLLHILSAAQVSQVALANQNLTAARLSLTESQTNLANLMPDLQAIDPAAALQLSSRLNLVATELNTPAIAKTDLDLFIEAILKLDASFEK